MVTDLYCFYQQHAARNHRAVVFWYPENTSLSEHIKQQLKQLDALHGHQTGNFRNYLGSEQTIIFYDARSHWNCNALVGLSGTLIGQGVLLVCVDQQTMQRPSLQHWLQALGEENSYPCYQDQELITFLNCWSLTLPTPTFSANSQQQRVLNSLTLLNGHQAFILYAPRGRGKTVTLGHWVSKAHSFDRRFICTPSKQQAAVYLQATDDIIFIPPDQLAEQEFKPHDLLIIDEAATLPMAAQNAALNFPGSLVLATTTEGYEYAGRGFIVRFVKELQQAFTTVHTHELQQPMRWAANDPLEQANSLAFGLYPNNVVNASIAACSEQTQPVPITAAKPEYVHRHCYDYSPAERFTIFRLLVEAHYQTSPNDIQRLLDEPSQRLVVQWQSTNGENVALSTAWLSTEGPLAPELIAQISKGKRRPPGNLLPQAYAYYGKEPTLATMRHVRVVRVTVAPAYQNQGLGSALVEHVYLWAQQQGYDALGTSFGINEDLIRFWHKNHWLPIRVGHKHDPASRYPSAIYARALNDTSAALFNKLSAFLITELKYRALTGHIPSALAAQIITSSRETEHTLDLLEQRWQQLGRAFAKGQLNFLDYQPWLAMALDLNWSNVSNNPLSHVLQQAVQGSSNFTELAKTMRCSGKNEALETLRNICTVLHQAV